MEQKLTCWLMYRLRGPTYIHDIFNNSHDNNYKQYVGRNYIYYFYILCIFPYYYYPAISCLRPSIHSFIHSVTFFVKAALFSSLMK